MFPQLYAKLQVVSMDKIFSLFNFLTLPMVLSFYFPILTYILIVFNIKNNLTNYFVPIVPNAIPLIISKALTI